MKQKIEFLLNNEIISVEENQGTVLLDFIRKGRGLTGTKEVCKEGDCGACAVIVGELSDSVVNYKVVNSCLYPLGNITGKHVVTIEGLNKDEFSPIQEYFINENASQCGFCTPGFIISLTAYLLNNNKYEIEEAVDSVAGNICRCTGYMSIKRSINKLLELMAVGIAEQENKNDGLIRLKIIPEYFKSVNDKLKLMRTEKDISAPAEDQQIVSGGTDLFVQIPDDLLDNDLYFGKKIAEKTIAISDDEIIIPGSTTFEELNKSELINQYIPNISKYMKLIASLPIRNSATVAGNIVNASPIGDLSILLLAFNAILALNDGIQCRHVALKDFYLSYKNIDKSKTEFLEEIRIKVPSDKTFINFEKVSKRTHLDIASVNSAIMLSIYDNTIEHGHIAFGGVAPVPLYLKHTSELLNAKSVTQQLLIEAIESMNEEISPISDIRGSDKYKRLLAKQIMIKHFIVLFPELEAEALL